MSGATPRLTVSQIETILGKAIKDPTFAAQLHSDPAGTLKGLNLTLHPDEIAFFKTLGQGNFAAAATTLNGQDPGNYSAEL